MFAHFWYLQNRAKFLFAKLLAILFIGGLSLLGTSAVYAAVTLTVSPITWNIIGLDSNSPASGPNRFPIGVRVCSSVATTNVVVNWVWDSSNVNVNLRPGSLSSITIASIAAGNCSDAYFEGEITQVAGAYDTTRRYHITATDSSGTALSPTPRELYVEHLISQNRNGITNIKLNGTAIPAGGTMNLMVGNTYTIELDGFTATQGYNQLESFINFPNTIFQILSVSTTYTADSNTTNVPNPNTKLYSDACIWDNDPTSPTYRSCIGGDDKAGGTVIVTYTVKIISGAGSSQSLNTLLYDFSGSSYHYNSDFSAAARTASIIGPSSVTIQKTFTPKAISPGGTSAMSFKLANPTTETFTGVNFTDSLPSGLVVASTPSVTTSGCGAGSFAPALSGGETTILFANGTLSPNSVCTITVNVTAASAGTFLNITGHLFINTSTDTGNFGTDTLTVSSVSACTPNQTLANWTVPSTATNPPDTTGGIPTTIGANVSSAVAVLNSTNSGGSSIENSSGQNDTFSWKTFGWKTAGTQVLFKVDTSNYSSNTMSFYARNDSPGPTSLTVEYSTDNGSTYSGTTTSTVNLTFTQSSISIPQNNTVWVKITASGANNDNVGADLFLDNNLFTGCSIPVPAPTITKSFASPIIKGATSTLSFTINNTASGNQALTGVAFSDVLPSGLSVADATTSQCGGTNNLTTTAATRTIALTGGVLAAGASCNFNVTVTGTSEGVYDNISGFISSTQSGTSTNYATASLTVIAPPILAKSFSPTSIFTGNDTILSFTISNPNLSSSLSGIGFTDTLPAGVTVATGGPTTMCSGTVSTTAPSTITFSGGSLAANTNCTFSITVTGATSGTKNNTTTAVTSTEGGNGNIASGSVVVNDQTASLDITKQVSVAGIDPWTSFIGVATGSNVYYRFKIYNSGDLQFTSVSVSDPTLASTSVDPATCNWTGFLPLAPGDTATCIKGPISATSGSHPNTATAQGTFASGTKISSPSTATYATTGLTIAKSATETYFNAAGNLLHYNYLVTNTGFAPLLGPVTVADDKSTNESCPAVSTVGDGDNYLDPGESIVCTATYVVTAADVAAKSVTNTASATVGGVTSPTDSKTVPLGVGALCVSVFNDINGDGARQIGENILTGAQITIKDSTNTVVATFTTNGTDPQCVSNLPPDLYSVTEINPPGYFSTSPDTVSANVSTGFSTLVEFGDQLFTPTPTATSTNTATPTATPTNTPTLTRTPTIVPSPTPVCLTLVRTSSNVSSPKGIALDQANSRVYVANFNSSAVTVLNENTGAILNTFLTGGVHSNAVAYLASLNRLYVSDRDNSSVSVLDATSGAQIAQIAVGDLPFGIAANAHNNRVYVANFSSGTVSVIDANVNTVTATIFVGANPTFIAIDPNTDNAYVVVRGANAVKVINLANNIIATISIATDGFGIAINPFTQRAYVSVQSNNTLAVINTQTNAIVGTINVPAQGFNLAVNTNGNAIYVNIPALARIYKIDGASNLISGFAATSLGADEGIAVNSATNRVYVSNFFANSVTVYTDSCAPAPTPSLTPTATNTPLPFGNICVTAYNDLNANGSRDLGEPVLAGATITIAPFGGSVIGTRVTDGSEPFCFTNLAPGLFVVTETDPLGATSTSPNLIAAIVASGISTLVDFGDQFPATNTPTPTFTATPSATPTSTPTVDPNTASICVSPFVDFNSNGILDAGEPPAIGAIISIAPIGGSTIDSWASDGNNPHCFSNLAQGLYFVTEIDPPGFASTSPNQVAVFAAIGFTTSVEFGDTGGAATLTPTATPSRTPTPLAPATLPVSQIFPNDPKGMVLDSARGRLFVISHLDNSVIVANENNLTPIKKIAVRTLPFGIGMINDKVYVANFGNGSDPSSVSVLNPATLTKSLDISLASCGGEATHLAVNPNNGFVYIALHGSARVAVINSATDALIGCVTVNAGTFGLAVHNASNKVFVGNRDGLDLWRVNSAGTIFTASRVKSFSNGQGGGAVFYVGVSNAFNKLFALVGLPSSDVPNQLYVYDIDSFGNLNNEQIISVGNTDDGGFVMQSQVCGTIYIAETADSSVRVLDSNLNFKTTFGSAQGIGIGPYGLLENPNLLRIYITNKISNTFTVLNECPGPEGPSSAPAPTLTRTPTRTPTRVSTLALAPSATRTLATIPTRFPTRTPTPSRTPTRR